MAWRARYDSHRLWYRIRGQVTVRWMLLLGSIGHLVHDPIVDRMPTRPIV